MDRPIETYPPHLQAKIDEAEAKQAKRAGIVSGNTPRNKTRPDLRPPTAPVPRRGRMNKTEAEFALLLNFRKTAKDITWFAFEPVRLRLADGAWYCPDFMAIVPSGGMVFYEVKGFEREAAIVRLKVAAELHPWAVFYLVKREKGGRFVHKLIGEGRGGPTK